MNMDEWRAVVAEGWHGSGNRAKRFRRVVVPFVQGAYVDRCREMGTLFDRTLKSFAQELEGLVPFCAGQLYAEREAHRRIALEFPDLVVVPDVAGFRYPATRRICPYKPFDEWMLTGPAEEAVREWSQRKGDGFMQAVGLIRC